MPALRRSRFQRPRSAIRVGTSSTIAATQTRAVTAAPGVQPASISPRAHAPDMPNAVAAPSATSKPIPTRGRARGSSLGCFITADTIDRRTGELIRDFTNDYRLV